MKTAQAIDIAVALLVLLCLAGYRTPAASGVEPAASRATNGPLSTEEVARKLGATTGDLLPFEESRALVQSVGRNGMHEHVARLREVAHSISRSEHCKVAFDALYSLWLLGEPRAFFLENAKACRDNPRLAYYSILVLAYEPTQETTEALSAIEGTATGNLVRGALSEYRQVERTSLQYRALSDTKEKLALLEQCILTGWNPIQVEEYEPTGNLRPLAVWAKGEISRLSQQEPSAVAQQIVNLRGSEGMTGMSLESFRAYFLRFVGEDVRAKYEGRSGARPKAPMKTGAE